MQKSDWTSNNDQRMLKSLSEMLMGKSSFIESIILQITCVGEGESSCYFLIEFIDHS